MKIIHLISGGDVGGAKTHVLSLLQGLGKTEQVRLVCFTEGAFADDARAMGIETLVLTDGVLASIRKAGGALLESVEMFDIYRGAQLGEGKKSVAFSLAFRNAERTLSDDDVNPVMQKILAASEKECGAVLRA